MKKLLVIFGILFLCIAVGLVILNFFLGSLVKKGVNDWGPRLTQTPVTLDDARLSPLSGTGTFRGLYVGNPEGWGSDKAFSLGEIHVDLVPTTLLENPIVIEELLIDAPEFVYEHRLTGGSNLKELIENIEEATGGLLERPIGEPDEPERKFIIKRLRLRNGVAQVQAATAAATVPLPELSYDDLGVEEGGLTAAQLSRVVLTDVLARVVSVATAEGLRALRENQGGDALESLGGAAVKGLQQFLGRGAKTEKTEETTNSR